MLLMFGLYVMQGLRTNIGDTTTEQQDYVAERFNTVSNTMVTLLMATTGGDDWMNQYDIFASAGLNLRIAYLMFICFFTMVAWNIVMSSFVEKACRLGMPDLEATAMDKYRQQQAYVKELGNMLLSKLDEDGDGTLSVREFKEHLQDKEVAAFCLARDINITDVDMFFTMLSGNGTDTVDIKTFARAIVRLRGNASAIDMQSLHFDLKNMELENTNRLCNIEEQLDILLKERSKPSAAGARLAPPPVSTSSISKLEELLTKILSSSRLPPEGAELVQPSPQASLTWSRTSGSRQFAL